MHQYISRRGHECVSVCVCVCVCVCVSARVCAFLVCVRVSAYTTLLYTSVALTC